MNSTWTTCTRQWSDSFITHSIYHQQQPQDMKPLLVLFVLSLLHLALARPQMIDEKEEFLSLIRTKNIAVIFYGDPNTQAYLSFTQAIPTSDRLYSGIEFIYVPASKFKLNRPSPSLSIYRKIGEGDWLLYRGSMAPSQIDRWIRRHISQQLPELVVEQLDRLLREEKKGFIVLDFGEFELIRTKIYVQEFCEYQKIKCFKITAKNPLLSVGLQLLGIGQEDSGISKLAFYNPRSQRLELYSKDAWFLTREQLLQLYEGRAGIVAAQSEGPAGDLEIELHYEEEEI